MTENTTFSWSKTLKTCDNNEKFAKIMVERFDQLFFDDALKQLHEGVLKEDTIVISDQLHKLWTNFLYIGAMNGEAIAKEMETILPQKNNKELCDLYLELLDETKAIKKEVSKILNKSPQTKEIEGFEKEIKNKYSDTKPSNYRSKVTYVPPSKRSDKEKHAKIVQEKIEAKELQLDPSKKQVVYADLRSLDYTTPKSKILDHTDNLSGPGVNYQTQLRESSGAKVKAGAQGQEMSDIKMNMNIRLEDSKADTSKLGSANSDLSTVTQRLVHNILSLSYDKVELELKNLQDTLKGPIKTSLESSISKLQVSAHKNIKNQFVENSLSLIKEMKIYRPQLVEAKFQVPTSEELDEYEKSIKQKFSAAHEFGGEIELEGKKEVKKTNCCCTF